MIKLFALILTCICPAQAAFTGADLYSACTGSDANANQVCTEWINGVAVGMAGAQHVAQRKKISPATCLPDSLTGQQARQIIEKFMRDRPELLHTTAAVIAIVALEQAFPCSGSN